MKGPKFKVGQVVRLGNSYFRVIDWDLGPEGSVRYRFGAHPEYHCIERLLRPLTAREIGPRPRKAKR